MQSDDDYFVYLQYIYMEYMYLLHTLCTYIAFYVLRMSVDGKLN